ncbi:biotin-dependent carboxyltransferase family protein [Halomonas sp. DP8Y7-1]|uniref:5-oxoprolinase subunit C family protein n=1 Tax=Halomonas sp. DP8Y7-1 TaxID=2859078 RepID=UPI001C9633CE|nr:biotin-dependent carboxyltransferase family protein [Halomonas sp. DP8Y7-1]MBY6029205.1 biotin-dependent carboxyltransferase family protein [Halomonas sp. DP8Y7-1]
MSLKVERAGPMALVVDGGRGGVRHLGVTQGGAMDWVALGWANWLLGNAPDAAGLEVMVGGLELVAEADICVALAGADLAARRDGEAIAPGQALTLKQGQRLVFERPSKGLRAYLALPGGVAGEAVMGSLSSTVREGLGGLDGLGRPLVAGDRVEAKAPHQRVNSRELAPSAATLTASSEPLELALVTGAQLASFDGHSLYRAFNQDWTIDQRADRMGIRLTGARLEGRMKGMVSEGIPLGAVQVPPDGQPIILMNDRQTIGGYPRLGALTPLACARLAQCLPGTRVRFKPVSPEQAQRDHLQCLHAWRTE